MSSSLRWSIFEISPILGHAAELCIGPERRPRALLGTRDSAVRRPAKKSAEAREQNSEGDTYVGTAFLRIKRGAMDDVFPVIAG